MAIATPNSIGGYDHDFVDTPHDRFICKICHFPSRDPYLSVCCGHLFCKSCLDNVKKAAAITSACLICRDEEFVTFPNKAVDREIKGFLVYCTNKKKGCEWQGELNDIKIHLGNSDGCQFEEVKCSNECGKMIQRRYLTSHVETECPCRKVNCQYCHGTGEHQFIEGQHKEECPKLPLHCPNKCEVKSIPCEDMEAHRKECPLEMIQCEYHSVGCKDRMARKDKEKHENEGIKEHLMMTKQGLSTLDDIQRELTNTKTQLTAALKQITNLTIVLTNAQFRPIAGYYDRFRSMADIDDYDDYDDHSHGTYNACSFSLNDTNLINIRSIQLNSMAALFNCGNQICPVTIKMPKYSIKKKAEVDWCSDPFYTQRKGYKMCLVIYADGNGSGKGTHLSVYLRLMKGRHDDKLTWPLKGKFEITLINQIKDSEHLSVEVTYDECRIIDDGPIAKAGQGVPKFISIEYLHKITKLSKHQFLKDDCLFFQVTSKL